MANSNNNPKANKRIKDRGRGVPLVPKAGFTKQRRRLEDGGKATT